MVDDLTRLGQRPGEFRVFLKMLISYYKTSIAWFWRDIDPFSRFQKFHFVFSGWSILIPYSRFQAISRRIFIICRRPPFSNFQDETIFDSLRIAKLVLPKLILLKYLESFGVPEIKYNWFGESWSRPLGPQIMKMRVFRVLP